MKIDSHIIFLIIVIGIISAGIVGATVMNNDTSMKEQVFDGIKVSVPADAEFTIADDGVYKDSNYGITINTFKNNDSMVKFLKNTKKSKIVPLENQPPQSVAFKKGKTINILVTNGAEGLAVSSKDGKLTTDIANSIIFSNNHKSVKPSGVPFIRPQMNFEQDFNLIALIIADVDTDIFNINMLQENVLIVVDDFNENLEENPVFEPGDDSSSSESLDESGNYTTDISNSEDLSSLLSEGNATTEGSGDSQASSAGGNDSDSSGVIAATPTESSSASSPGSTSSPGSSSSSGSSNSSQPQEMSLQDCKLLAQEAIKNDPNLSLHKDYKEVQDGYEFTVVDDHNKKVGTIVVNALTGEVKTYM